MTYKIWIDKQASTGEVQTAQNGTCMIVVEKLGISTNQILSAGQDISITNGVIATANVGKKRATLATAQVNTRVDLSELSFRYNSNATTGNLEIRSTSTTAVPFTGYSYERYSGAGGPSENSATYHTATALADTGTFLTLNALGLDNNGQLYYTIRTATNVYRVELNNFNDQFVNIKVEKDF